MKIRDIMNTNPITISPDEPVALASRLLSHNNIGALPVCTENGRIRGLVTDRDIVLRCVANSSDPETTPVSEIMTRIPITVSPSDDVTKAASLMSTGQIRRLPVVEDGRVVGMVSLGDMARRSTLEMEAGAVLSRVSSNVIRG